MKKLVFLLLLFPTLIFAQNPRVFSGKCAISQTGSGAGYWTVSITQFNDPLGLYDATEITTGDKLYLSDGGVTYTLDITLIVSAVGSSATVRVSNVGITGLSSVPTTSNAAISRGTANYKFIPWFANLSGNDNQGFQEHNVYLIDSLIKNTVGGIVATIANDTTLIIQTAHGFVKGQLLSVVGGVGYRADADSIPANAVVINRVNANSYIVQFSGITDSLTNVEAGKYYYLSGIKGEVTQVPQTRNQLVYRGLENGRAELLFSNVVTNKPISSNSYISTVLSTKPDNIVAYYPMNEASGNTMTDVKNSRNGTYSASVTKGVTGIGDSQTAVNVTSTQSISASVAGVLSGFSPESGAVSFWINVDSAWLNDGAEHFLFYTANGSSAISIKKLTVDSTLQLTYKSLIQYHTMKSGWNHIAFTWDVTNNRMNGLVNGNNFLIGDGFSNPLPVWTGGAITSFIIGNSVGGGAQSLDGDIAHFGIWNNYLSNGEINRLSCLDCVDFTTHPNFKTVSQKSLFTAPSGETNNWLGRASMIDVSPSLWIAVYRSGIDHNDGGGDLQHIRFSDDEGVTWSKRDTLIDGTTPVSNWPLVMHATTTNASVGPIFVALNGDIIVHQYEEQPTGHKTYQWRSTDDGETWADEGIILPTNIIGEEDYTIIPTGANAGIYIVARDFVSGFEESRIYRSVDNGTSWVFRGSSEIQIDANELGIVWLGGDTLLIVMKTSDQSATYRYYSYDAGATWTARQDITSQVGLMNKPRLSMFNDTLYLHGRFTIPSLGRATTVLHRSVDDGLTWTQGFYPDSLVQHWDCGYGDILKRSNGDIYMMYYAGDYSAADIVEYIVRDTYPNLIFSTQSRPIDLTKDVVGVLPTANGGSTINGLTDNYIIKADGTSDIEISTLYEDASGNIGHGTTSPEAKHHIKQSNVTGSISAGAFGFAVENEAGNSAMLLQSNRTRLAEIAFGDDMFLFQGGIRFGLGGNTTNRKKMLFYTDEGATPRMAIDSVGRVGILTTTPEAYFHLQRTNVAAAFTTDFTAGIEHNSDDVVFGFLTNSIRASKIWFGDEGNITRGGISYYQNSHAKANTMEFFLNGAVDVTMRDGGVLDAVTGFRVSNAATSGNYLRGNGTNFVSSAIQAADVPSLSGTVAVRLVGYTVATLPAGTVGDMAYVTDATAPTYLGTLTGGGAVVCPVFYNGSAWVSH